MDIVKRVEELRTRIGTWRAAGERIGFVPTMGNLHAGHYALVALARERCQRVVASVYVNPTQFGPSEDYATYPRTPDADQSGLIAAGCDLLFLPESEEVYPAGTENNLRIEIPSLCDSLCGAFRPGHFSGVATVVCKLFNMVVPDVAVFGQKDYQQLMVIRRLVLELAMPIEIVPAPTLREASGLALSSRNQYLSPDERSRATVIHKTLMWIGTALRDRGRSFDSIEWDALNMLSEQGMVPDYVALRRASDLSLPSEGERSGLVALIAARLGRARLIDNMVFDIK